MAKWLTKARCRLQDGITPTQRELYGAIWREAGSLREAVARDLATCDEGFQDRVMGVDVSPFPLRVPKYEVLVNGRHVGTARAMARNGVLVIRNFRPSAEARSAVRVFGRG